MKKVITVILLISMVSVSITVASSDILSRKDTVTEAALGIKDADIKHQQPVIKTFDTKLGTVTALTNGGTIGELPDPVKLEQEIKDIAAKQLPEASPLGGVHISGTLPPYSADEWGTVYLQHGETVTVSLSWYPSSSEMIVGLKNVDTGVISWGPGITGGSGTWYLSAWQTGSYNIVILNHSGETVTYSGYVSW